MSTAPQYLHLPELVEYRRRAAERRARAFTDATEHVLGIPVTPITPDTYSMLVASGSRFVCPGVPTVDDVLNFIWFHSPLFVYPDHPEWRKRKRRALRPLMVQACGFYRATFGVPAEPDRYYATLALAVIEISERVAEAFADAPVPGEGGAAVATLEANMIHIFTTAYGWDPEQVSAMPLKRLFQLYRCICSSRGQDTRDHREDAILSNHLARRNAELAAQRENAQTT